MNLPSITQVELANGIVKHQRFLPKPNGFTTGVCFVRIRFSPASRQARPVKLGGLAIDRPGFLSISAKNYGLDNHKMYFPELVATLTRRMEMETGETLDGEVYLQTFPKVMGFVFNPVSFWFFHNAEGSCRTILCEVNNTFGERHFYMLHHGEYSALNRGGLLKASKAFHVSPFFPVTGRYEFRFMQVGNQTVARINYLEGNETRLTTSVSGEMKLATSKRWVQALLRYGWFTVMVVFKIHWQALKLLAKGAKFHTKPEPPAHLITNTQPKRSKA